jgi:hypothetical protein
MRLSVPVAADAWVSRVGAGSRRGKAELRRVGPDGVEVSGGTYLVSFLGTVGGDTVHAGSVLVASETHAAGTARPVRYQPKRDGTSYMEAQPIHDAGFTVTIDGGIDQTALLETGPVDVPDYSLYTAPTYPPSRTDGGVALETLERQCMLLFPTTLLPGAAGIPGMLAYSPDFARQCAEAVAKKGEAGEEQVRMLAGALMQRGARWVDERADDTGPAQLKLMRGDDCDGLSVSARALLHSVGQHCRNTALGALLHRSQIFLVAGTANLGGRVQAHMWVAVFTPGGAVNCECTAVSRSEEHFRFAAYAWSRTACYVLVGADGKIGVRASALSKSDLKHKLPASGKLRSALSAAYYHVLDDDGSYADRTTGAA